MMAGPLGHHTGRAAGAGYPSGPSGYDAAMGGSSVDGIPHHMVPVHFPSLVNYGVQAETVRQLTEMKAYLWRHVSFQASRMLRL